VIRVRATKYDPSKRDSQGNYNINEFTSSSDVGKTFGKYRLTADDYVLIEDAYVACVRQLLAVSEVDSLRICELEDKRGRTSVDTDVERLRPAVLDGIYDGMVVKVCDIDKIVRMSLREVIWCKLSGDKNIYVNFGHDYYMYIGNDLQSTSLGAPPQGMFYEEMESPYG
jgi:hypothetical protein